MTDSAPSISITGCTYRTSCSFSLGIAMIALLLGLFVNRQVKQTSFDPASKPARCQPVASEK